MYYRAGVIVLVGGYCGLGIYFSVVGFRYWFGYLVVFRLGWEMG